MPKYRKKPIIVEAYQVTIPKAIETKYGRILAITGDYVEKEFDGGEIVVPKEMFEQTHELVEE